MSRNLQVRHVFFAGGFFAHPLTQQLAIRHWLRGEVNGKVMYGRVSYKKPDVMPRHLVAVNYCLCVDHYAEDQRSVAFLETRTISGRVGISSQPKDEVQRVDKS